MFGFIKRRKEQKELFEQFEEILKADLENELKSLDMTTEELSSLSDEGLYSAIESRTENKVNKYDDVLEGIKTLSNAERNFYICQYYEMEVNNGGLCQFFVNSSREVAPFLSGSLEAIGAAEHKKLFDEFVNENKINLNDLSSFIIRREKDFEKMEKRYPFDDFDDKFYELEPIEDKLVAYIRKNINQF